MQNIQKKYLQYQKLIEKQSNNQLSQICDFMSGPLDRHMIQEHM